MVLYTLYHLSWIFFIYGFFGWCVEVIFHAVSEGKFINRGFLIGPICPIYGFGVLAVVQCLEPIKDNLLLLFFGSFLLTSLLEFLTGFILEKFFKDKWWDYSNEPFNICGYVCIRFSLAWGLACVFIIDIIYPMTMNAVSLIPFKAGIVILCIFYVLIFVDLAVTLTEALKLRKLLIFAENAEKSIRKVSDGIGEALTNRTLDAIEKIEEGKEVIELGKVKVRLGPSKVQKRILKAYPRLKEGRYKESLQKLKERFKADIRVGLENKK